MTLAAFLALASVQLMAAISPGPAVLMTARTGVTQGLRMGVFMAAGIGLGAVFWAVSALFGLAILFKIAPALLIVLKVVGGAYLLWIAIQMWRHAPEPLDTTDSAGLLPRTGRAHARVARGERGRQAQRHRSRPDQGATGPIPAATGDCPKAVPASFSPALRRREANPS